MYKEKDKEPTAMTPGEILLTQFMEPNNISQNKLSREIDVPVGRVNQIIKGKRAITADTALRLAKFFGNAAEYWMNLQSSYDLGRARNDMRPKIEPRIQTLTALQS